MSRKSAESHSDVTHSYATDERYFNRYADGYEAYTAGDLDLVLSDLLAALRGTTVTRACEVGCADGQFSAELAHRLGGAHPALFVGLDIAGEVLKRYPFTKLRASGFDMPLAPASLDLLCYVGSLHHLAPFEDALTEASRVLKPGGLLYLLEPNRFHPHRRLFMSRPSLYRWYRDANDTPVDPFALQAALQRRDFQTLTLRFVTIAFRRPGWLQRIQNALATVPWPQALQPYVSPWFLLILRRGGRSESHRPERGLPST